MCGCLSCVLPWGPGRQPRHVPRLGIKHCYPWFTARAQSTQLRQPERIILIRGLPYIVFYITLGLGKEGEKLLNSSEFFKGWWLGTVWKKSFCLLHSVEKKSSFSRYLVLSHTSTETFGPGWPFYDPCAIMSQATRAGGLLLAIQPQHNCWTNET